MGTRLVGIAVPSFVGSSLVLLGILGQTIRMTSRPTTSKQTYKCSAILVGPILVGGHCTRVESSYAKHLAIVTCTGRELYWRLCCTESHQKDVANMCVLFASTRAFAEDLSDAGRAEATALDMKPLGFDMMKYTLYVCRLLSVLLQIA